MQFCFLEKQNDKVQFGYKINCVFAESCKSLLKGLSFECLPETTCDKGNAKKTFYANAMSKVIRLFDDVSRNAVAKTLSNVTFS